MRGAALTARGGGAAAPAANASASGAACASGQAAATPAAYGVELEVVAREACGAALKTKATANAKKRPASPAKAVSRRPQRRAGLAAAKNIKQFASTNLDDDLRGGGRGRKRRKGGQAGAVIITSGMKQASMVQWGRDLFGDDAGRSAGDAGAAATGRAKERDVASTRPCPSGVERMACWSAQKSTMRNRRASICADVGGWNAWRDRSMSNLTRALDRFDITDVIGFDPLEIRAVSFAANEGAECAGAVDFAQVRLCCLHGIL